MFAFLIVVLKAKSVPGERTKYEQMEQQLFQELNDLKNETKSTPDELHKLICRLNDDQVEILNSVPDRHAVTWIWSRSQIAFENLRALYERPDYVRRFSCLAKTPHSTTVTDTRPETIRRRNVDIDIDQFKKEMGKSNACLYNRFCRKKLLRA